MICRLSQAVCMCVYTYARMCVTHAYVYIEICIASCILIDITIKAVSD
jgi:hypothetical protein